MNRLMRSIMLGVHPSWLFLAALLPPADSATASSVLLARLLLLGLLRLAGLAAGLRSAGQRLPKATLTAEALLGERVLAPGLPAVLSADRAALLLKAPADWGLLLGLELGLNRSNRLLQICW
jgi:hypothetical protein